jgi:hypothetical protein
MSVTLTTDQASRLLVCMKYGFSDAEAAEFRAALTTFTGQITKDELIAERLESIGEHGTAWHLRYTAGYFQAPAYHTPAVPEITATTEQKAT